MNILICIDDTDNIDSIGTGELAQMIARSIEERSWGRSFNITRHQLYVHEDIPYTSHNSSMCFKAEVKENHLPDIIEFASDFLAANCAEGSDPGFCLVNLEVLTEPDRLINFGKRAKETISTKEEAYQVASSLDIHLSEHGGDGQGIIGALAGTGLRLSGNDGRFKGKLRISSENESISVKELCSHENIDEVRSLDGETLRDCEIVLLGEKVKTVLLDNKAVLLVFRSDGMDSWETCTRQQLRVF